VRALECGDPRAIGRYRLLARLGAGGMAVVYFGRSPGRRAAAVKVMHAELAADAVHRERFRREVTATRTVGGLLDADPDAAIPWLATEFLAAVSLRDAVRDHGPLPPDAARPLAAGIAEALAAIHRAGMVHRDVKPANVLLTADGPRIVDFGIAGEPSAGHVGGSFGFMSPEQVAGGPVGPAGDVYSLGVTLTYAVTGTRDAAALDRIADAGLRGLIARCLRLDPDERPTVAELLSAGGSGSRAGGSGGSGGSGSGGSGAGVRWLPAAVRADIDRRAGEARNPPVAPLPLAPRPVRRRTLLLVGGGGLAAVAAGGLAWVRRADRSGVGAPIAGAVSADAGSPARIVEIYAYGSATVKTLTTVVNGQIESLEGVPLPYRRTVPVPPEPALVSWRFAYRCSGGVFDWVITDNGYRIGGGGGSGSGSDLVGDVSN
jgi:uncharacterized membrane protein YgcG